MTIVAGNAASRCPSTPRNFARAIVASRPVVESATCSILRYEQDRRRPDADTGDADLGADSCVTFPTAAHTAVGSCRSAATRVKCSVVTNAVGRLTGGWCRKANGRRGPERLVGIAEPNSTRSNSHGRVFAATSAPAIFITAYGFRSGVRALR